MTASALQHLTVSPTKEGNLAQKLVKYATLAIEANIIRYPLLPVTSTKPLWVDFQSVAISSRCRHNWNSALLVKAHVACDLQSAVSKCSVVTDLVKGICTRGLTGLKPSPKLKKKINNNLFIQIRIILCFAVCSKKSVSQLFCNNRFHWLRCWSWTRNKYITEILTDSEVNWNLILNYTGVVKTTTSDRL